MLGEEPESTVIGSVISETALGQCTTCGACEDACPVGIEHLQLLLGAKRAQTLAIGTGMVATDFLQTMEAHGNPFAAAKDVRKELIQDLEIPLYEKGKTDYLLWLGCVWSYNPDSRSGVEALVKVLKQAGVGFGVLETRAVPVTTLVDREKNCSFRPWRARIFRVLGSTKYKTSSRRVPIASIPYAESTPDWRMDSPSTSLTIPSSWRI